VAPPHRALFFSQRSPHLRHLHSCPTRRSSDLWVRTPSAEAQAVLPRVFGVSSLSPVDVVVPAELDAIVSAGEAAFRERVQGKTRSEEHTSELQSREKLVCRLLLEKKNKVPANW